MSLIKDRHPYKILIVEDNPADYRTIQYALLEEIRKPQLNHANTFKECKRLLGEQEYDAILLDLSLPDKSGAELVQLTLDIAPSTPVIILTGYEDMSFAVRSLKTGVTDYLLKDGFNPALLYKAIIYGIQRNKYLRQIKESEKRYADLFHFSPLPMWIYQEESSQILDVNQSACMHYGYSREEFLKISFSDLFVGKYDYHCLLQNEAKPICKHRKKTGEIILVELDFSQVILEDQQVNMILAKDITRERHLQEELINITLQVEDEERSRISSSLHDGLQQTLLSAFMRLETIEKEAEKNLSELYSQRYKEVMKILKEGIRETRNMAHQMMPTALSELGISAAIAEVIQRYIDEIDFDYQDNLESGRLPENIELVLFRISQELITNIVKHSEATCASVILNTDQDIVYLKVTDNGKGMDTDKSAIMKTSFGLKSIMSRVKSLKGNFNIVSDKGQGTTVSVQIPIASTVEHLEPPLQLKNQ